MQKNKIMKKQFIETVIVKFENGKNVPSLQVLQRLANGLGKRLIVDFIEPEEDD